jgi:MazG family protein
LKRLTKWPKRPARKTTRIFAKSWAILDEISEKLIRRHPHVFGESDARDSGAVLKQWEAIKREEKKSDAHYLSSLPSALPALMRAQKAQSKVARVNFDWTDLRDVIAKVEEELGELKSAIESEDQKSIEDEVGDLVFAVVNLSRKSKLDAESALQAATDKFVRRFNLLEDELRARGKKLGDADLAELDAIWNEIKRR